MIDLEGNQLEVGTIYHILGSGDKAVVCRYSHETEFSFIFKSINTNIGNVQGEPLLYTWKRVINKYWSSGVIMESLPVVKVSQTLIDKYKLL